MYKEFFRDNVFTHLPIFALFLFLAVFLGTLAWLFIFQRKSERFAHLAKLPLEADFAPGRNSAEKDGSP